MWVSEEALKKALGRLKDWSERDEPNPRFKQTLYRFLLLRQLGVSSQHSITLSSSDFKSHCVNFLLVSDESSASSTGGRPHYFEPFAMQYQKADGSDWAVGTVWTQMGTRGVDKFLVAQPANYGRKNFQFKNDFEDYFALKLSSNPLPALALGVYLLRESDIPVSSTADEQAQGQAVIDAFLNEFKLKSLTRLNDMFDLSPKL